MKTKFRLGIAVLMLFAAFAHAAPPNDLARNSALPKKPGLRKTSAVSLFQINLTWRDQSANEDGFQIERSSDGKHFTQIAQVLPDTTTYRDTELFPGTKYFYRIRAFNTAGHSDYSTGSAKTPAPKKPLAIVDWNSPSPSPTNTPGWVSVKAGADHTLALKKDGTVVGWGDNSLGQAAVPTNLTGVVKIAAGRDNSLALKNDGTVVAWGIPGSDGTSVPENATRVVAIAAGDFFSLALKNDGTVVGWGNNSYGQTSPPSDLTGVVAIAAGATHSLALKSDGTVVGWGGDNFGEATPPANLTSVISIAAGSHFSVALQSDGTIVGWGYDNDGEASNITNLTHVTALAAGSFRGLALKNDGTLVEWGQTNSLTTAPDLGGGVVAVALSDNHSVALSTAPVAPSDLRATVLSATQVRLSWRDHSTDEKRFEIQRATQNDTGRSSWIQLGTTAANKTNFTDATAKTNTTYFYRVRAFSKLGTSPYCPEIHVITAPLTMPESVTADLSVSNQVTVSWVDNYSGVDGFEIWRAEDEGGNPGAWDVFASVTATNIGQNSFGDATVLPNHMYRYQVRAFNTLGFSPLGGPAPVAVIAPDAPQSFSAIAVAERVLLSWFPYPPAPQGYKIDRAPDVNGAPGDWTEIGTASPKSYSYLDIVSSPNITYWYRVRAFNWVGISPYSDQASVTVTPPTPPLSVTAVIGSTNSAQISWADYPGDELGFRLERAPDVGGSPGAWTEIALIHDRNAFSASFDDTNVVANNTYWYRVRAFNALGNSDYSDIVSLALLPPLTPILSTAIPIGDTVSLRWYATDIPPNVSKIERAPDADGAPGPWTEIATLPPGYSTYVDTNLAPGATYWYRVRSANWVGNSPYSGLTLVTIIPPVTPFVPAAGLGTITNQVILDLGDPAADEDGFLIERAVDTGSGLGNWTQIAVVNTGHVSNFSYTDTNAIAYATNWYRVRTFSTVGVSDYSAATSLGVVPPVAPPYAYGYPLSDNAEVNWYDYNFSAEATLGYKIERAPDIGGNPGTWTQIAIVNGGAYSSAYADPGRAANATYWYRVRAFNWVGDSDYCLPFAVTITPPSPPAGVQAGIATVTNQVTLTWFDNLADEDGFTIERAPDLSGSPGSWTQIGSTNLTNSYGAAFTDTNAMAYTTNWYRVRAFSASGVSSYSAATSLTIVPPAPPYLSAFAFAGQITLSWNDFSGFIDGLAGFKLERAPDSGGNPGVWTEITNTPDYGYVDTGRAANTTYWYRLRSYNWLGDSPFSNPVSVTITPPSIPNNLFGGVGTTNEVDLQWYDNAADANSFKVERAPDVTGAPGTWVEIGTVTGSFNPMFADTNVIANTTNWYRVRAFNDAGISDYTAPVTVSLVPPDAPANLSPSPFKDTIQLFWSEFYAGQIGGFNIQRAPDVAGAPGSWTDIGTNFGLVTSYVDSGRSVNTTYWYRVRAFNWIGNSPYSSAVNSKLTGPSTPNSLYGYLAASNQVVLAWYDNSADEDGFNIQRAPDIAGAPGSWTGIGVLYATNIFNPSFIDTNAIVNATNWYRVQAFNVVGTSDFTSGASVAVMPPGTAPTLYGQVSAAHQIDLSWYTSFDFVEGFKIERALDSGGAPGNWVQIADVPGISSYGFYSDRLVVMNKKYWYRVQAYSWVGVSPYSDPLLLNDAVPLAPLLVAANDQPNQISLSWNKTSDDITGFKIERAADNGGAPGTWIEIASQLSYTTQYTDTGIPTGQTNWYRIRALNAVGNSPYSNVASASARDGQFLRVMQWNVERTLGRLQNNSGGPALSAANIVNYNHPDVLLLCEVDAQNQTSAQNAGALADWVTNNVPYFGTTFYVAVSSQSDGFIRNAAISRYPIVGETTYDDGLRGLHAFQVKLSDANSLEIFHTHLKCCSDDCSRKQTEAEFDTNIIGSFAATNSLPYIFAGDWNEEEEAQPPVCGLSPTYHPISTIRSGASLGDFKPTNLSGEYRTWSSQQAAPSIRFDYILAATNRITPLSGYVFSSQDWQNHGIYSGFNYYDSSYASDHYSVIANYFFAPPKLVVTPTALLAAAGYRGGPFSPSEQTYSVSNSTAGPIDWTVSQNAVWLTLPTTGGTLVAGATTSFTLSINTNANLLSNGVYSANVVFSNATDGLLAASRPASVTVNDPATLTVSPLSPLNSLGTIGGPFNPSQRSYTLSNAGIQSIDWHAAHLAHWISLSSSNGTLAAGSVTNLVVSINATAAALPSGDYGDIVSITNLTSGVGNTARTVDLQVTSFGFFDDFSTFTTGALVGQRSWAQGLASATLPLQVHGGRVIVPRAQTGDNQDAYKNFTTTNGTVFFGMTLIISNAPASSAPSYFAALYTDNNVSGFANYRLSARDNGNGTCVIGARMTGQASNPFIFGTTALAYGTEHRVIVEADAGGTLMHVFIDPTSADLSSQTADVVSLIGSGSPPATVGSFVFSQFNSTGSPVVGFSVGKTVVIDDFATAYYDLTGNAPSSLAENQTITPAFSTSVPPPRIFSITPTTNGVQLLWSTMGGSTDIVQASGSMGGDYSNISPPLIILGLGETTTNYLDDGALTNAPARFYRIRR